MKTINSRVLYIVGYLVLILFSTGWVFINKLPLWMVLVTTLPPIVSDGFSNYSPRVLAYIYTHRKGFAFFIFGLCVFMAGLLYYKYPLHIIYFNLNAQDKFILITQFILQGAIVGLTLRMLLLNFFADLLRATDIHLAKFLIIVAWIVFLIMFPFNEKHVSLSSIFIFGLGFGFLFHYLVRIQEKKNAQINRFRENVEILIENLKRQDSKSEDSDNNNGISKVRLTNNEETAIKLYSKQKWVKLKIFLHEHASTGSLFFIKICMLRKLHNYEAALELLQDRMKKNHNLPHENYYHLHAALNKSEIFDVNGNWKYRDEIFEHLEKANTIDPSCLLTCTTYALRIAEEVEFGDEKHKVEKEKALELIWEAMKIYEHKPLPTKIIEVVDGMLIPFTYTFLMESYGYVLLKCGKTRFAKALILQSLFQDPTYSNTYLHLAELYMHVYGKISDKYYHDTWRQSARLNLQVAIEMEKENDKEKRETLISTRAKKLMEKISTKKTSP